MFKLLATLFFVINALFWGLWDHGTHCKIASAMGASTCPPHSVHIMFGIASFLVAVGIAQSSHFIS